MHDQLGGLLVDIIHFLRVTSLPFAHKRPILVLILQLSRLENDRLRKLLIQHVQLVSQRFDIFLFIISFQVLLDIILHFLLRWIFIGRLGLFSLLLIRVVILVEKLFDCLDAALGQCQFGLF